MSISKKLHWPRFILTAASLIWGILLLIDPLISERPGLAILDSMVDTNIVCGAFLVSAAAHIAILFDFWVFKKVTVVFDTFNAGLWCFIVTTIIASEFPPPATIATEIIISLISIWILIQNNGNGVETDSGYIN